MSHPAPRMDYSMQHNRETNKEYAKRSKSPKHKALNAAQKASERILGGAAKDVKAYGRKEGEAPLQHLKRLIK